MKNGRTDSAALRAPVKKVLFIQHASVMGGSVKSLARVVTTLDPARYQAFVCLVRPTWEVVDYYKSLGLNISISKKIWPVSHTSGSWLHFSSPVDVTSCLRGLVKWGANGAGNPVRPGASEFVHLAALRIRAAQYEDALCLARSGSSTAQVLRKPAPSFSQSSWDIAFRTCLLVQKLSARMDGVRSDGSGHPELCGRRFVRNRCWG
jgi:hypothetical protein